MNLDDEHLKQGIKLYNEYFSDDESVIYLCLDNIHAFIKFVVELYDVVLLYQDIKFNDFMDNIILPIMKSFAEPGCSWVETLNNIKKELK